jgi:hypothetical protein
VKRLGALGTLLGVKRLGALGTLLNVKRRGAWKSCPLNEARELEWGPNRNEVLEKLQKHEAPWGAWGAARREAP